MDRGQILILFTSILVSRSRRCPDVSFLSVERLTQVQIEIEVGRSLVSVGVWGWWVVVVVIGHVFAVDGSDPGGQKKGRTAKLFKLSMYGGRVMVVVVVVVVDFDPIKGFRGEESNWKARKWCHALGGDLSRLLIAWGSRATTIRRY
jgi:hypothetical protein